MNDVHDPYGHAFAHAISFEQLAQQVPAAFSEHAADTTGPSYVFISTKTLIDALHDAGFVATQARQAVSRCTHRAYARHLLRFQPRRQAVTLVDAIPQVVLINSHDGRSAYQLRAGLFRPICTNGLLTRLGDFGLIHVAHRGNVVEHVVEAALTLTRNFSEVGTVVERMHARALSLDERIAFAQDAIVARYRGPQQHQPFDATALLQVRRSQDAGDDLWHVFNVVQENVLRGGLSGRSASGRPMRSRAIRAIQEDVRLNNDLWQLALARLPA
jgi:hypothetical protein